ncbi:MAG: YwaF family protein [Lachnospiraceae bacterium]|nr:YwaF family protein [Lachnospiraceae bacterium]
MRDVAGEGPFRYFWMQQDDIPQEVGYPLFGKEHLLSVFVTLALAGLAVAGFRKMRRERQEKVLKAIPPFMLALELFKDLFLASVGRFGVGYLPLHFCSLGLFVFFLREYLPWEKCKAFFGEIAFVLILPGSLFALFDADWTELYPVLNFINLHSYLWHGVLVLYPMLLVTTGRIHPSIRHIHWNLLYLAVVVPPIYAFDRHFHCNYFFIHWPIPNSPLSRMAELLGNPGYLIGYALLVLLVILVVYGCTGAVREVAKHRTCAEEITDQRNRE